MQTIKAFFRAAPGAVRGAINLDELCRILVLAVLAHKGVLATLSALNADAPALFVSPADLALYTAWTAAVIETVRRFSQADHSAEVRTVVIANEPVSMRPDGSPDWFPDPAKPPL